MELIQPTTDITTKKTEAETAKLNQIRNNISVLEGETVRLRSLIEAEKYEINQMVLQKKELEDLIPGLVTRCDTLEAQISSATTTLTLLEVKKKEAQEELAASKKIADKNKSKYEDLLATVSKEQAELKEHALLIDKREAKVAEEEAKLQEKLALLKSIM